MTKESFSLITQQNECHECEIINLDYSFFEEVYAIDLQAFKELDGRYIKKNKMFIETCLRSKCSVGIKAEGKLIATVTTNIEKLNDTKRASILGFKKHWPTFIGFIEGVYVFPTFRKHGLATKLYSKAIQLFRQKTIQNIYSAIDPRNYANIIAMTKSDFVLQNLYHSNLNGDLRYLIKHYPEQQFSTDKRYTVPVDDHDTQVTYFQKDYVGFRIMMEHSESGNISGGDNGLKNSTTCMMLAEKS